jgi:hypothetical protein
VAYYLTFFCRSGEENGSSALARLLSRLQETGPPVLVERRTGRDVDEVAVCGVATDNGAGAAMAGQVTLELSVGVRFIADCVIEASPDDARGVWGSDLRAQLTLSGETDWALVERVWSALIDLWGAVAWDEMSGFEINESAPHRG